MYAPLTVCPRSVLDATTMNDNVDAILGRDITIAKLIASLALGVHPRVGVGV